MEENKDTRTKKQKATDRVQFAAVCWCLFLARWNDGTTSPLLPRIQEVYCVCYPAFSLCPLCYLFCTQVNFTIVSLIFIFIVWQVPFFPSAFLLLTTKLQGFILGALTNVHLTYEFGFERASLGADLKRFEIWVLTWLCDRPLFWVRWLWQHLIVFCLTWKCLGSILQIIAYALQSPAPPFPVFVMAFTINGFGIALQVDFFFLSFWCFHNLLYFHVMQDAQDNGLVSSLKHQAEAKMGILHAVYGEFSSPFIWCQSDHSWC